MYLEDLDEEDYEIAVKVVIVGNGAVGKSSMIQRYCKGIFTRNYKKTIGVDFLEKHITASGEDVRLMLWDTAGQEEFDAITKAYYRGAQACVIAFSTTDRASFDAVKKWKRKVEDECGHIPMVLVQNKIDLLHESQVDNYEIEKFARNTGLKLFRTSVKENLNVAKVFHFLAERHIEAVSRWSDEADDAAVMQIGAQVVNPHRDVRVRFASSTENIEDNDSGTSGGSGSSSGGGAYFPTRLLPLHAHFGDFNGTAANGIKSKKKKKFRKQQQQQQQQQLNGHMGNLGFRLQPHPHAPPQQAPNNKTIVLNPFRRRQQQPQQHGAWQHQQHYYGHPITLAGGGQHLTSPAAPVKPSCRVI